VGAKKILVPVDGSDGSCRAAAQAAELARALDAEVTLVHVYDATAVAAMGLVALSQVDLGKAQDEVSKAAFSKAEASMGEVKLSHRQVFGDPAKEILAMAENEGFIHIVMGSRGLSPMQEVLIGSVSERVIRHAPCPVTVVR